MRRYLLAVLFLILPVFLSGCSSYVADNAPAPIAEVFSTKPEVGSIWKTNDSGKNFSPKSQIDEKTIISSADILSITFHPTKPGTIYISTIANGIFKTENNGETWDPISFPSKRIYSYILDKNDPDNRMFASGMVGDWGKILRTNDGGKGWEAVYTEPGKGTNISALSQNFRNMKIIFAGTSAGTVIKSTDEGETWKNIGNKINGIVSAITFDSAKTPFTYLLSFERKLYYSADSGETWNDWEETKRKEMENLNKRIGKAQMDRKNSLAKSLRAQADALNKKNQENRAPQGIVSIIADPNISGTIYAGTNSGLFRSTDFGKYWSELNIIKSAKGFTIRSIAVNPKNSKEISFVAGKAFYRSTDNGETWEVTGLNVDRDAAFIAYDPFDPKYLFLGLRKF